MHTAIKDDRRQHPRKVVDVEVHLSCASESEARHTFTVHDVSLSGMSLSSMSITPKIGDTLCLCLAENLDRCRKEHVIEATVVHEEAGLLGVRFDTVGVLVLKDIQRLLREGRMF